MPIASDFTIDYTNKRVYHSANTNVYSVNAFYSWLMDTFDELAQLDDPVPMEAPSAQQYRMINGWFMPDADFKYLTGNNGGTKDGGSIETVGQDAATYADGIRVLTFQAGGYTAASGSDLGTAVVGTTTGDTGTLLAYDNTLRKWWVRTDALDDAFDQSESVSAGAGGAGTTTAASATGESLWSNLYSIGSDSDIHAITLYLEQNSAAVAVSDISAYFDTLKVTRTGTNIVTGDVGNTITHTNGDSGTLVAVDGTTLYINPDSMLDGDRFDDTSGTLTCNGHADTQTAAGVSTGHIDLLIKVKDFGTTIDSGNVTTLAREWGYTYDYYSADLSNGGRLPAPIAVAVDPNNTTAVVTVDAYTIGIAHGSYTEDVTGDGSNENYEAQIDLNSTYTVAQAYEYTKAVTRRGQTGTIDGVQGQLYKSANASYAVVKANPFGSFAGGKFFGARGVYFLLSDRPASQANLYELIDSDGNTGVVEPTSITIQVTGVDGVGSPNVDRVFIAQTSGGLLQTDQYTTAASGNSATSSTVTLTGAPQADTPASGVIRLQGKRYEYSEVNGAVFTLDATAHPTGLDEDNNSVDAYVPFIDEAAGGATVSVGVSYAADRDVLCRVRQKGIIPFETTGQITNTGYTVQAIRTADGVVT